MTKAPEVIVSHCYVQRGVAAGWVTPSGGRTHRIGHQAFEGWFCSCQKARRCPFIQVFKMHVPAAAIEHGAAGVRAGTVPAGVCEPIWAKPNDAPRVDRETSEQPEHQL